MPLDPEVQKRQEAFYTLTSTPEWGLFEEMVKDIAESKDTLMGVGSLEQLWMTKGQHNAYSWIANFRTLVEATSKSAEEALMDEEANAGLSLEQH